MYANRVSLTGFLGKDAEIKTTRNNASFTVLSLATKRSWKDRETEEWKSETTWHRVIVIWNRTDFQAGAFLLKPVAAGTVDGGGRGVG